VGVGDEGGFAPNIVDGKDALLMIKEAIEVSGYTGQIKIGMDTAASEFCEKSEDASVPRVYNLDIKAEDQSAARKLSGDELADLYRSWLGEFDIVTLEDPFEQDDFESWAKLTASVPIQIVGDDLTVTNSER
ncbi:putative Enolase, partial [Hypsibius exemplaris]